MKRVADPDGGSPARRRFLVQSLAVLGAPALLSVWSGQALARGPAGSGTASISVRDKGARGDGKTDDTRAFQAAIDALPATGGTVLVPPGNYMIDASRSVNLRPNMTLQMDAEAQLTAIPNNLTHYSVVKVFNADNSSIVGGRIVGERDNHDGTKGEWGFGLNIRASSNVKVSDIHISDCWGDGIWVGALGRGIGVQVSSNVTLDRVVCSNNRRQGMSVGPVQGLTVTNSTFTKTNGTAPEAGIDLEPLGQGPTRDVSIIGCTVVDNHGTGVEMHDHVAGVEIRNCVIRDNNGYGVLGVNTTGIVLADNQIIGNGLFGVVMAKASSDVKITGNTLANHSARYVHRAIKQLVSPDADASKHPSDLRVDGSTSNVHVSANKFSL